MENESTNAYTEFDCETIQETEEEILFEVMEMSVDEIRDVSSCNDYLALLQNSCDLRLWREDAIKKAYRDNAEAKLFYMFVKKLLFILPFSKCIGKEAFSTLKNDTKC